MAEIIVEYAVSVCGALSRGGTALIYFFPGCDAKESGWRVAVAFKSFLSCGFPIPGLSMALLTEVAPAWTRTPFYQDPTCNNFSSTCHPPRSVWVPELGRQEREGASLYGPVLSPPVKQQKELTWIEQVLPRACAFAIPLPAWTVFVRHM